MEYVDLGLSVKWATCNLGASNPADCGDYFAWAETSPKESCYYDWGSLAYWKGWTGLTTGRPTKYKGKDFKTLTPEDDAATAVLGSDWRMPTVEEIEELVAGCDWKWETFRDSKNSKMKGFLGKSKANGAQIFFPCAGYRYQPPDAVNVGIIGSYWSSTLAPFSILGDMCYELAGTLRFHIEIQENSPVRRNEDRRIGLPVRAVYKG